MNGQPLGRIVAAYKSRDGLFRQSEHLGAYLFMVHSDPRRARLLTSYRQATSPEARRAPSPADRKSRRPSRDKASAGLQIRAPVFHPARGRAILAAAVLDLDPASAGES